MYGVKDRLKRRGTWALGGTAAGNVAMLATGQGTTELAYASIAAGVLIFIFEKLGDIASAWRDSKTGAQYEDYEDVYDPYYYPPDDEDHEPNFPDYVGGNQQGY